MGLSGAGAWRPLDTTEGRETKADWSVATGAVGRDPSAPHALPPQCVVIGLQSTGEARTREVLDEKDGQLDCFVSAAE